MAESARSRAEAREARGRFREGGAGNEESCCQWLDSGGPGLAGQVLVGGAWAGRAMQSPGAERGGRSSRRSVAVPLRVESERQRLEFIVGGARNVEDLVVPGLRNPARWVGSGARGGATRHVVLERQCAESIGDLERAWFRSAWEKKRSPAGRLRGESGEGLELVNGAS